MNSVIDILKISNIETIGSSADSNIKYVSDIDLQEIIHTDDFYTTILQKFQKKFIEAQNNPNVFIIDFKCGMFRGELVRWNKKTIKTIVDIKILMVLILVSLDAYNKNQLLKWI